MSKAVLHDPRVRKISFTGSTPVGRALLQKPADQVISCAMELGGNAPFIVCKDANLNDALDGAMLAKMRNSGEACTAANRFLAHAAVADEFAAKLSKAMAALKVGPGIEAHRARPADRRRRPGRHRRPRRPLRRCGLVRMTKVMADAVAGFFFSPTVLTGVTPDDPILDREVFGPIAPVVTFETDDEAVGLANNTPYGLAAYLYGGDLARNMRVAERVESGMVGINRGLISDPAAQFGGVKQSGVGREGGHEGMLEYLEAKYIAVDW